MTEYNLDDGAFLSEVKQYDLSRGQDLDGRLSINVHKIIAGENVGNYVAAPNIAIGEPHQKYVVVGPSEEEVLAKCLDLIKGVPARDIFPSLSLVPQENE